MDAFQQAEQAAVYKAIFQRPDIRRFRSDPLLDDVLWQLLEAAHQAPSVGFMQPWNFIVRCHLYEFGTGSRYSGRAERF